MLMTPEAVRLVRPAVEMTKLAKSELCPERGTATLARA
jgi:hypothetical protein